jgi:hypothetical protein
MSANYYIDLDNTLCHTINSNYEKSTPIIERIEYVNSLKQAGNHITIWTARGSTSGINHEELTKKQLGEWNIKYDQLLMKKPDYDVYYDDKSFNIDTVLPVKNKEKDLQQIFGAEAPKASAFIKSERIDFKKSEELKTLIRHMNQN